MRFQNVFQRVYGEPWNITKAGWYSIHEIVRAHWKDLPGVSGAADRIAAMNAGKRPTKGFWGDAIDQMTIANGVARIPIKGPLMKGASLMDQACGAASYENIHEDLDSARAQGVKGVVLDISSPGGTVLGMTEVGAKISALAQRIPVLAFTDELMCSAAYYLAAGASAIFATPSAMPGSIGTIWQWMNVVEQLAKDGVDVNVFASGPLKGIGSPYLRPTEEQIAWVQSNVDRYAEEFKSHVRANRPDVEEETMQGQSFSGTEAAGNGLIDGLVSEIGEVMRMAGG